eukprot:c16865_g1_i1 orf=198-5741(-)
MEVPAFGMLLSKLKDPHPTVQRYAVRSIFEAVKEQADGKKAQQALVDCMLQASRSLPALDEALSQLCALVVSSQEQGREQEEALTILVLTLLQAALECVPSQAVPSVIRSIGFVCRHLLRTDSHTLLSFQAYELHPFVKAFKSRSEGRSEVLQQVLTVLTQEGPIKDRDVMRFLQPFLNYIFLDPLAHNENLVAARELHFSLASLVSMNFLMGISLTRLLMNYNYHFTLQTPEEAAWKVAALRELLDTFEALVMQASLEAEVDSCKQIVSDIQALLIDTCYESKKQGLSFLPVLELIGRIVKLQKFLETTLFWREKILYLAHLLAMTDLKEEQLALIGLARKVLRKTNQEGMDMLIDSPNVFPSALLWVFPTTNVIASSCTSLKSTAVSLLQDLEDLLAIYWTQKKTNTVLQSPVVSVTASYGQLADNMYSVLLHLWFDRGSQKTWKSLESIADWIDCNDYDSECWLSRISSHLEEYFQSHLKISNFSNFKDYQCSDLILWVCMLVSVILIHPVHNYTAMKVVAVIGKGDPVCGFSLVPVVLFYLRTWKRQWTRANPEIPFRLMNMLPSLAVHPMASSIVAGTLQSFLHSNGPLPGTAIRLLCKTWEIANRVYPYLQVQLDDSHFSGPVTDFQISASRAASINDVCKRDADLGVELILSIQACIESENVTMKAFGLQSLSWLCQYDMIDFYTAWDVLFAWFSDVPTNPALAESLCCFLQNGALDAAAYPDRAFMILQLLWKAATMPDNDEINCEWWTVRKKALNTLSEYQVDDLHQSFGEVRGRHIQILLSEGETEVLGACEKLVVKFLWHEFKSRRRGLENVKHAADNKVGKIIAAIPRVFFASVQKEASVIQSPAAFLLLNRYKQQTSQGARHSAKSTSQAREDDFEQQFSEMADNMNLQGNLILALLYLDPWYSFINEKLKEKSDGNISYAAISTAAFQLMKVLRKISGEAIPRVAENAILALAVLYRVSQETLEGLGETIVTYLKSCLAQNNHEYLQWTSAVALGYAAQYCKIADWRLKLEVSTCLLECLFTSDRDIVRGACSMALGFLFHNLFTQNDECKLGGGDTEGMVQQRESDIHALIFQNLLNFLQICCPEMTESLQKIRRHTEEFPSSRLDILWSPPTIKCFEKVDESIWTVAGLTMALGSSVVAFERIGALESLSHVTKFLIQGVHCSRARPGKDCFSSLALGSFISLPLCIGTCLRLELLLEELDILLQDVKGFLTLGKSDKNFPAELRMAACIGSGNLLATLLCCGTYKVLLEDIHSLTECMKFIAVNNNSVLSSLGGFMGLANALGAGAALMMPQQRNYRIVELKAMPESDGGVDSSYVCTPLLFESSCKSLVQNLTQDILNSALHGSSDMMSNAWWALALIRRAFIKDSGDDSGVSGFGDAKSPRIGLTSLSEESSLFILCSWLLNVRKNLVDSFPYHTVASVLRCLKEAPMLPYLDWGTLLRQMLHEAASSDECVDKGCQNTVMMDQLCKECVLFSLAHAHRLPNLQAFLDELCDLSRLISLRMSVSSILMLHMTELSSIFSRYRMEKFFLDSAEVTCRASKSQGLENLFSAGASWQLKASFWEGLKSLLSHSKEGFTPTIDKDKLFLGAEKCLLLLETPLKEPENRDHKLEEWSAALECMALISEEWVMKVTEFDWEGTVTTAPPESIALAQKAIFIKSQMVARHTLSPSALVRPVKWLCNQDASCNPEVFQQLLWIVSALKGVVLEEKQQWLLEAIETASLLKFPDTGLLFFALLVSSWCSYAPLFLVDMTTTIKLLPFTLPSLLSEEGWRSSSMSVLQRCIAVLYNHTITASDTILCYVKRACTVLRRGLPLADQLRLVDDLETLLQV